MTTTTTKSALAKTVRVGRVPCYPDTADLFCRIEIEDGKLSISGVIGPKSNGDARGGCGQIDMEFAHRNPSDNGGRYSDPIRPDQIEFALGWTADLWLEFLDVWQKWHMNDCKAGCEHQRKMGWDRIPIDPAKPLTAYGKHFPGQKYDSWNMAVWIRRDEHPNGLLCEPCPECGYKYGSAWLREELPANVVEFLQSLPDTDKQPAWV